MPQVIEKQNLSLISINESVTATGSGSPGTATAALGGVYAKLTADIHHENSYAMQDFYISQLTRFYSSHSWEEVKDYLMQNENSFLILELSSLAPRLQTYFGIISSAISLELESDYEEAFSCLSVNIATSSNNVSAAYELLDSFDEEWWLDMSPKVRCRVIVTINPE